MKNIPGGHNLFVSDKETASVIENLYSVSSREIFLSQSTFSYPSQMEILNPILLHFIVKFLNEPSLVILHQKFKLMMARKDENSKKALLNQLGNINKHLEKRGTRFLTGDTLCCFDTELMPRLQHIR